MFGALIPIVAMCIPIVAIVGGFVVAAFRTRAQQAVAELHMKERIAAIEKGIDPATLPPLPVVGDPAEAASEARSPRQRALELAQGLFVGGIITASSGAGLAFFFLLLENVPRNLWAVGVLVAFVGAGLLASGFLVRQGAAEQPDTAPSRGGWPTR